MRAPSARTLGVLAGHFAVVMIGVIVFTIILPGLLDMTLPIWYTDTMSLLIVLGSLSGLALHALLRSSKLVYAMIVVPPVLGFAFLITMAIIHPLPSYLEESGFALFIAQFVVLVTSLMVSVAVHDRITNAGLFFSPKDRHRTDS